MQRMLAIVEIEGSQYAHQSEKMITMYMRNKNMVELSSFDIVFGHLELCAFATIEQKTLSVVIQEL
jgi:hypothetical protein